MAKQTKPDNKTKQRLRNAYITTVISITLVLFLLGTILFLVLNTKKISDYVKENISVTVVLKDNVKEADIIRLQKELDAMPEIKQTSFVSKNEAAEDLKKDLGEDFVNFLGYNPLLSSINANLYADFANNETINRLKQQLEKRPQVKEVFYKRNLIHLVNENIKKITLVLLGLSLLLFLIAISLINNTIRLSIYAHRFLIYTMQLVGASRNFIRIPYLTQAIVEGIISAVLANLMLLGLIVSLQKQFSGIIYLTDRLYLLILMSLILIVGIVITVISAYFATNKQLNSKLDKLYYG
jgi:cell division transport system permease protein